MRFELGDPKNVLLDEIERPESTRDDVASTYGLAIRAGMSLAAFEAVNLAIIERWSAAALAYIKQKAWKKVEAAPSAKEGGES